MLESILDNMQRIKRHDCRNFWTRTMLGSAAVHSCALLTQKLTADCQQIQLWVRKSAGRSALQKLTIK